MLTLFDFLGNLSSSNSQKHTILLYSKMNSSLHRLLMPSLDNNKILIPVFVEKENVHLRDTKIIVIDSEFIYQTNSLYNLINVLKDAQSGTIIIYFSQSSLNAVCNFSPFEKFIFELSHNSESTKVKSNQVFWTVKRYNQSSFLNKNIHIICNNGLNINYPSDDLYIPFDISSIGLITGKGHTPVLIEDIVESDELVKMKIKERIYSEEYTKLLSNDLVFNGISIPQLDREFMVVFWFQFLIAENLLHKLAGRNIVLDTIKKIPYSRLEYPNLIFESLIKGLNLEFKVHYQSVPNRIDLNEKYERINDSIVLTLHISEFYRFRTIITTLAKEYGEKFCIVPLVTAAVNEDTVVYPDEFKSYIIDYDRNDFPYQPSKVQSFNYTKEHIREELLEISLIFEKFKSQFQFLYEYRFPALLHIFQSWEIIFDKYRPRLLITSDLNYSEFQIPRITAERFGIQSLIIQHGVNTYLPRFLDGGNLFFISSHLESIYQYLTSYKKINAFLVSELEMQEEFEAKNFNLNINQTNLNVLILIDATAYNQIAYRYLNAREQIATITQLIKFFEETTGISGKFKVHPKFSDLELFDLSTHNASEYVLDPATSLIDILPNFDLIVGLNYSGPAIVHSSNIGKPILFCFSDSLYQNSKFLHNPIVNVFGDVVTKVPELLDLILKFKSDLSYRNYLMTKTSNIQQLKQKFVKESFYSIVRKAYKGEELTSNISLTEIENLFNVNKIFLKDELSYNINALSSKEISALFVVIVAQNSEKEIEACKKLVKVLINTKQTIVVVHNSCVKLEKLLFNGIAADNFTQLRISENSDISTAINLLALTGGMDYLVVLDSKHSLEINALTKLIQLLKYDFDLICGPKIHSESSKLPEWYYSYSKKDVHFESNKLCGLHTCNEKVSAKFPFEYFGLNWAVKTNLFLEAGGLTPFPKENSNVFFSGDGTHTLFEKLSILSQKSIYTSDLTTYINVDNKIFALENTNNNFIGYGILLSYINCRRYKKLNRIPNFLENTETQTLENSTDLSLINEQKKNIQYGYLLHQFVIRKNYQLLSWVVDTELIFDCFPEIPAIEEGKVVTILQNINILDSLIKK